MSFVCTRPGSSNSLVITLKCIRISSNFRHPGGTGSTAAQCLIDTARLIPQKISSFDSVLSGWSPQCLPRKLFLFGQEAYCSRNRRPSWTPYSRILLIRQCIPYVLLHPVGQTWMFVQKSTLFHQCWLVRRWVIDCPVSTNTFKGHRPMDIRFTCQ